MSPLRNGIKIFRSVPKSKLYKPYNNKRETGVGHNKNYASKNFEASHLPAVDYKLKLVDTVPYQENSEDKIEKSESGTFKIILTNQLNMWETSIKNLNSLVKGTITTMEDILSFVKEKQVKMWKTTQYTKSISTSQLPVLNEMKNEESKMLRKTSLGLIGNKRNMSDACQKSDFVTTQNTKSSQWQILPKCIDRDERRHQIDSLMSIISLETKETTTTTSTQNKNSNKNYIQAKSNQSHLHDGIVKKAKDPTAKEFISTLKSFNEDVSHPREDRKNMLLEKRMISLFERPPIKETNEHTRLLNVNDLETLSNSSAYSTYSNKLTTKNTNSIIGEKNSMTFINDKLKLRHSHIKRIPNSMTNRKRLNTRSRHEISNALEERLQDSLMLLKSLCKSIDTKENDAIQRIISIKGQTSKMNKRDIINLGNLLSKPKAKLQDKNNVRQKEPTYCELVKKSLENEANFPAMNDKLGDKIHDTRPTKQVSIPPTIQNIDNKKKSIKKIDDESVDYKYLVDQLSLNVHPKRYNTEFYNLINIHHNDIPELKMYYNKLVSYDLKEFTNKYVKVSKSTPITNIQSKLITTCNSMTKIDKTDKLVQLNPVSILQDFLIQNNDPRKSISTNMLLTKSYAAKTLIDTLTSMCNIISNKLQYNTDIKEKSKMAVTSSIQATNKYKKSVAKNQTKYDHKNVIYKESFEKPDNEGCQVQPKISPESNIQKTIAYSNNNNNNNNIKNKPLIILKADSTQDDILNVLNHPKKLPQQKTTDNKTLFILTSDSNLTDIENILNYCQKHSQTCMVLNKEKPVNPTTDQSSQSSEEIIVLKPEPKTRKILLHPNKNKRTNPYLKERTHVEIPLKRQKEEKEDSKVTNILKEFLSRKEQIQMQQILTNYNDKISSTISSNSSSDRHVQEIKLLKILSNIEMNRLSKNQTMNRPTTTSSSEVNKHTNLINNHKNTSKFKQHNNDNKIDKQTPECSLKSTKTTPSVTNDELKTQPKNINTIENINLLKSTKAMTLVNETGMKNSNNNIENNAVQHQLTEIFVKNKSNVRQMNADQLAIQEEVKKLLIKKHKTRPKGMYIKERAHEYSRQNKSSFDNNKQDNKQQSLQDRIKVNDASCLENLHERIMKMKSKTSNRNEDYKTKPTVAHYEQRVAKERETNKIKIINKVSKLDLLNDEKSGEFTKTIMAEIEAKCKRRSTRMKEMKERYRKQILELGLKNTELVIKETTNTTARDEHHYSKQLENNNKMLDRPLSSNPTLLVKHHTTFTSTTNQMPLSTSCRLFLETNNRVNTPQEKLNKISQLTDNMMKINNIKSVNSDMNLKTKPDKNKLSNIKRNLSDSRIDQHAKYKTILERSTNKQHTNYDENYLEKRQNMLKEHTTKKPDEKAKIPINIIVETAMNSILTKKPPVVKLLKTSKSATNLLLQSKFHKLTNDKDNKTNDPKMLMGQKKENPYAQNTSLFEYIKSKRFTNTVKSDNDTKLLKKTNTTNTIHTNNKINMKYNYSLPTMSNVSSFNKNHTIIINNRESILNRNFRLKGNNLINNYKISNVGSKLNNNIKNGKWLAKKFLFENAQQVNQHKTTANMTNTQY